MAPRLVLSFVVIPAALTMGALAAAPGDVTEELAQALSETYYLGSLRQEPPPPNVSAAVLKAQEQRGSGAGEASQPGQRSASGLERRATPTRGIRDGRGDPAARAQMFLLRAFADPDGIPDNLAGKPKELAENAAKFQAKKAAGLATGEDQPKIFVKGSVYRELAESATKHAKASVDLYQAQKKLRAAWNSTLWGLLAKRAGTEDLTPALEARAGVLRDYIWVEVRNTGDVVLKNCVLDLTLTCDQKKVVEHLYHVIPRLPAQQAFRSQPLPARLVTPGIVGMADERWPQYVKVQFALICDEGRVKPTEVPLGDGTEVRRALFLDAFASGRTYVQKKDDGTVSKTLHFVKSEPFKENKPTRGNSSRQVQPPVRNPRLDARGMTGNGKPDRPRYTQTFVAELTSADQPKMKTRLGVHWTENPQGHLTENFEFQVLEVKGTPSRKADPKAKRGTTSVAPPGMARTPNAGQPAIVHFSWEDGILFGSRGVGRGMEAWEIVTEAE